MINFKIRSNESDDPEAMNKYEHYFTFLKESSVNKHWDLHAFFVKDFFHDGSIRKFKLSADMQNIKFEIACPNIKNNENGNWGYIDPVWFACRFGGVAHFQLETQKIDQYNDPLSISEKGVLYLESEIETLTDEIRKYSNLYNVSFHSIIIKTLPMQRYFSLVFRTLKVEPADPVAFEAMKQNRFFDVPLFTGE
jgi:hypothetical protein